MQLYFLNRKFSFLFRPFFDNFFEHRTIITNNIDPKIIKNFLIKSRYYSYCHQVWFAPKWLWWMKTSGLQVVVTVIQRLSTGFVGQIATSNPWWLEAYFTLRIPIPRESANACRPSKATSSVFFFTRTLENCHKPSLRKQIQLRTIIEPYDFLRNDNSFRSELWNFNVLNWIFQTQSANFLMQVFYSGNGIFLACLFLNVLDCYFSFRENTDVDINVDTSEE